MSDNGHEQPNDEFPLVPFSEEWGESVRKARNDLKITQPGLGKLVGTDNGTISRIEKGQIASSTFVIPICRALKIPLPAVLVDDDLDARWIDSGRALRIVNEGGFRGLLRAAEEMIVFSKDDSDSHH